MYILLQNRGKINFSRQKVARMYNIFMKNKNIYLIALGLVVGLTVILLLRGQKDNWTKDNRGLWTAHGRAKDKPSEVTEQENLIAKALTIYLDAIKENKDLSNGPCLGSVQEDWALDIAHEPRQTVDEQSDNQCANYLSGQTKHLIELDEKGSILRIK